MARLLEHFHAGNRILALDDPAVSAAIEQGFEDRQLAISSNPHSSRYAALLVFFNEERGEGAKRRPANDSANRRKHS